jgi:glycosyltransferase involved in cell wall biosynthesis
LYGIERMLLSLLPALRARGREAELICFGGPDSPSAEVGEAARARGIPVSYLGFRGKLSVPGLTRFASRIDARHPAIVHLHGYKAVIFGGLIGALKRVPAVATCHAEALRHPDLTTYVRIETQVIRRVPRMVAVSEPIARELRTRGVRANRIRVIPNGIEDPLPLRSTLGTRDASRLLVVGRLVDGKNVGTLIDVVARLRATHPTIELVVAGDGPLRPALEAQARGLGVADIVQFVGFVPALASIYEGAGLFVLPSSTEGMPISLLEAMAFGVPIVSTSVGSIPSVVRDGVEALLVPPDDPDALQGAVDRALRDAALRQSLVARARARFEAGYTADTMADAYVALYDEMTGRATRELRASA